MDQSQPKINGVSAKKKRNNSDEIDQKVGQNSLTIRDGKIPMESAKQTAETESILNVAENDDFRGNSAIPSDSIENKVHCKAANTMKQAEVLSIQKQPNISTSDQIKHYTIAPIEQVEDLPVTAVKQDIVAVSHNSERPEPITNNEQDEISLQSGSQGQHKRGLPAGCLFVASLPTNKKEIELQQAVADHFRKWGALLNVKVLFDWLNRPYSFVQFESIEDAQRALTEAHNSIVDGRHIRVEKAKVNRTLLIGRFSRDMKEDDITKFLEPYGATEDIHILKDFRTGQSRGCAFVKFCYREDAISAYMSLRRTSSYVIEWAANLEKATPGPGDIDKGTIFVGQLNPEAVTKDVLEQKFSSYGEIKDLRLVTIKKPGPTGRMSVRSAFAFIRYDDENASTKAIEAENNTKYFDRIIRVQYRESPEYRNYQIQILRQQLEVRQRALQTVSSYGISDKSNNVRMSLRPPALSKAAVERVSGDAAHKPSSNRNRYMRPASVSNVGGTKSFDRSSSSNRRGNGRKSSIKNKGPNPSFDTHYATMNIINGAPSMAPFDLSAMNIHPRGITQGFNNIPNDLNFPPLINTPEGLVYPYAPPFAWFGHDNSIGDDPHENPATLPHPILSGPYVHQHCPPCVPGERDAYVNAYGHLPPPFVLPSMIPLPEFGLEQQFFGYPMTVPQPHSLVSGTRSLPLVNGSSSEQTNCETINSGYETDNELSHLDDQQIVENVGETDENDVPYEHSKDEIVHVT
ncbi:RNA-binding domain-containing protein [Gigaspora margarita]|uniref:RNA-binding domain-containing protein n=1 Tax=Gigaspora margarita TaxID=4874 RepID=A0A8H3WXS4_GIGMA|nr:RNA-binding domain-containing protein [Gigaspora margarita]